MNNIDWNNKKNVLEAVNKKGYFLKYASKKLKNDKDVVLTAVHQHGYALCFASDRLKNNKEVVLSAVNQDGYTLCQASEILRNDKDVVLAAVNQSGFALQCVSEQLKNDKEVVLAAVNKNGHSLSYASEELQNDKDVVLAAVNQYGTALYYASEELQNDLILLNLLHKFYKFPENKIEDTDIQQWFEERMKIRDILMEQDLMKIFIDNYHKPSKSRFLKFQDCLSLEYASKILQNDLKLLNLLHYYYNFPENKKEDRENQKWFEERMKILDILIQKILT